MVSSLSDKISGEENEIFRVNLSLPTSALLFLCFFITAINCTRHHYIKECLYNKEDRTQLQRFELDDPYETILTIISWAELHSYTVC